MSYIPLFSSPPACRDQWYPPKATTKIQHEDVWPALDNEDSHSFHHAEEESQALNPVSTVSYRYRTTISGILGPTPNLTSNDQQLLTKSTKCAGKVLTSHVNMKIVQKKEEMKFAKEKEKMKRQKARMEKQQAKLESKKEKSIDLENHHRSKLSMNQEEAAQGKH